MHILSSGIDVEPALRWLGANEKVIHFYTMPGVGNLAVAYLLYKLATPARYTVTMAGTHQAVRYLRQWGYLPPIPPSESLRSLAREGKTQAKAKYDVYQGEFKDKIGDIRDEIKERRTTQKRM